MDENPLAFDHMFRVYLDPDFIECLSTEGKHWLARTLINMIMIDKTIHHTELSYLEDAIGLVDKDEEREELKQALKERKLLSTGNLETDRDYAGHFFYYLAMNVAADGKITKTEADYLREICGRLGFPPQSAKQMLSWAFNQVIMSKERQEMVEGFRHVSPVFAGS